MKRLESGVFSYREVGFILTKAVGKCDCWDNYNYSDIIAVSVNGVLILSIIL